MKLLVRADQTGGVCKLAVGTQLTDLEDRMPAATLAMVPGADALITLEREPALFACHRRALQRAMVAQFNGWNPIIDLSLDIRLIAQIVTTREQSHAVPAGQA